MSKNSNKKTKTVKSYQDKMDINRPFDRITKYDLEEESIVVDEEDSSEGENSDGEEVLPPMHSVSPNVSAVLFNMDDTIGRTGNNILRSSLKNKQSLFGIDCCAVLAWKQGKGSKHLRGKELKRFQARKVQKLAISKVCHAGAHLEQMRKFLESKTVHLNQSQEFVEISSDIVAHICHILTTVASMTNVDDGAVSDYFNQRFADLRNRKNYETRYLKYLLLINLIFL